MSEHPECFTLGDARFAERPGSNVEFWPTAIEWHSWDFRLHHNGLSWICLGRLSRWLIKHRITAGIARAEELEQLSPGNGFPCRISLGSFMKGGRENVDSEPTQRWARVAISIPNSRGAAEVLDYLRREW